jgi:hypothetical protein
MAMSGQWVLHHMQAVHRSGWTTFVRPWPLDSKTFWGQNSMQMPHPLHQVPKIDTWPRGRGALLFLLETGTADESAVSSVDMVKASTDGQMGRPFTVFGPILPSVVYVSR